ncbi:acyclic terpene utilization AtuA family protein [Aeromicrobium wangtongii]|uniref:acyclic terpene utilization AtuA family protein n=1 Tax=Aeromicrobium wangtongii TaxID=2969247 RepID=UPI0020172902|nr:acyclic terpene utilization AtuA family protein [Aeromicrobium wangtongii]MCL3817021.1 acyclic terpene utilization AtuA family protein [Aeromicrobium wangtongii]
MSAIRVGNCSGYYGDRFSAMREMLEGGPLDYLTGDYLAELTMLILGRDRMKDESLGYAKTFARQMGESMALAKERGVKIVANAGGLNPAALAEKLREIAGSQGLDLTVAHVEGDDLRDRAADLAAQVGSTGNILTANAYLGAFGIAAALTAGADVVVTGRVTDASVVVGPAIAHFGWGRDDLDRLAGAVVAGHVIECGTQATGGNFAGFGELDLSAPLGFPIAEIAEDGSVVITKHEGTGGAVTVDTVTAQLVYEIGSPLYLGPDVSTRLDTMSLVQDGPDRVAISGVVGEAPPATTKVCLNEIGGFRNSVEFLLTGLDIAEKAALVEHQMEAALSAGTRPDSVEWHLDRTDVADPATQAQATSLLRLHVKSAQPEPVGRAFSDAAIQLALASYPGFSVSRPPAAATPFGIYRPAYVPQTDVPHTAVHPDGRRESIPPPASGAQPPASGAKTDDTPSQNVHSAPVAGAIAPLGDWAAETVRAPLGRLALARSGDKGGDANIGVWIPAGHPARDDAYAWLVSLLDEPTIRELLPEAATLDLQISPLPNLRAVNIVIHGLLGDGVASSTRLDPQAKGLGEWLRARDCAIPSVLLPTPIAEASL